MIQKIGDKMWKKAPGVDSIFVKHLRAMDDEAFNSVVDLCQEIPSTGYMTYILKY